MANPKASSGMRNFMYSGKHALLPPKSPFPSISGAYADYVPNTTIGSKFVQKPREGNSHHQRTSSESLVIEEQPSWLDDLLNEPDAPIRKGGHRRSSSDSFPYLDTDFDYGKDARHLPMYAEIKSTKKNNRAWDSSLNAVLHSSCVPSGRDIGAFQSSGSPSTPCEAADGVTSNANGKLDSAESSLHDTKVSSEKKDGSHAKAHASETDTKRAKQQFAQRSRVRKLQYIAELERNVQALQAEGSEVSAEVEFLNQQHLILSMENKALNQRLESLAQEHRIKRLEQEVLEREIARLRALHQQQQQPQQPSGSLRRTKSKDLDSQFSNLSLRHKDSSSGRDPMTGPVRT
ncbi:hypothetical protein QN277_019925 [Acacia crassicarpa]|uniref:BZIP domain-containing protein n=1 Tax=Acacia crassicarpa TaxID=499986 RepID=A0AAE1JMZ9_9FABA|nr:hypothetical protein QN277_019925 [Acacia crassicarpa]